MKKIFIFGVVRPRRANVFVPEVTQDLYHFGGERIGSFSVQVKASEITAVLEVENNPFDEYESCGNSLLPRIEAIIDAYGFLTGGGYGVELTKLVDSGKGVVFEFPTYLNILPRVESFNDLESKFKLVFELTRYEEGAYFQKCLAEMRKALRYPYESPVHCFKAVEAIRQIYGRRLNLDAKNNRSKAWNALREDLSIEKSTIQEKIQKYSDPIRHGEIQEFSQEERTELLRETWKIVHLYVEKTSEAISNNALHRTSR